MLWFPKPAVVSEQDYRVYVIIAIVTYIGAPVHFFLIFYFHHIGANLLALLNIASTLAWSYSFWANRRGQHQIAITLVTIEVFTHTVACTMSLGLSLGFHHYLWGGLTFIMLNNGLDKRSIVGITTGLGLTYVLLSIFARDIQYAYAYPEAIPYIHITNVLIAFVASGLVAYHFRTISQQAEQHLNVLAGTDPLTGLFNRRRLFEELQHHIALADREYLSVHRQPHQSCETIAEDLRRAISNTPIALPGRELSVSVTIGGAHYNKSEPIEACIKRADVALYQGKQAGRNRVVFSPESVPQLDAMV